MTKRMLIDAAHPEETRVAVVNGSRLEEFDFESASKQQLKGNIYLAKVTRVEPSLQAAFVEYGGNRHGFLAFSEIHPDYYRIPVADREALIAQHSTASAEAFDDDGDDNGTDDDGNGAVDDGGADDNGADPQAAAADDSSIDDGDEEADADGQEASAAALPGDAGADFIEVGDDTNGNGDDVRDDDDVRDEDGRDEDGRGGEIETVGGDDVTPVRSARSRARSYKIQEVIKRRQILLVQVAKEERGNKGAALTTFISLAGRYCVLMPNTPRGGGISRKIANPKDRKRLKGILEGLDVPDGMAVILRTAGLERTKAEMKRDLDYLIRLWDSIREVTLGSTAPTLIHEEGDLIKRSIRDLYSKDVDEVWVAGTTAYRTAKDFMKMLMPSHAKKVQHYKEDIPLFHRYQVESQIDALHQPISQLRSGGYIVINPTEALVAIDVNSGRSTRERNIEETAYRTNLEAADEIARQLRLRDLAGLIVIDFIDMDEDRHGNAVERRLKEAMKQDRARIQIGRISSFGLLELSRQRLRPSFLETHFVTCQICAGTGHVRTLASASLHVLRAIEEEGIRRRSSEIAVHVATDVALYILNQKRAALAEIEQRYDFLVMLYREDTLLAPEFRLERVRAQTEADTSPPPAAEPVAAVEAQAEVAESEDEKSSRRRRRPRRGRKREDEAAEAQAPEAAAEAAAAANDAMSDAAGTDEDGADEESAQGDNGDDKAGKRRRRRGKRGGRRRSTQRTGGDDEAADDTALGELTDDSGPVGEVFPPEPVGPVAVPAAAVVPIQIAIAEASEPDPLPDPLMDDGSAAPEETVEAEAGEADIRETAPEAEPAAFEDAEPAEPAVATREPETVAEAVETETAETDATEIDGDEPTPPPETPVQPVEALVTADAAVSQRDRYDEAPAEAVGIEASTDAADGDATDRDDRDQGEQERDEDVNRAPERPRRGWWQRLMDG